MEFRVLGPLQISVDERVAAPRGAKDRAFLGELLAHAGQVVSTEHLVETVWRDRPPADHDNAVYVRVSRLRALFRSLATSSNQVEIVSTGGRGYRLDAEMDAHRFEALLGDAERDRNAGRFEEAARKSETALGLWHGDAYTDVDAGECVESEARRLGELRLSAMELHAEALLALGAHAQVATRLFTLVERHPFREKLHAILITALHGAGRSAEALAAYSRLRATLVEELGAEPSAELRSLHQTILAGEPLPRPDAMGPAAWNSPFQLPPGTADFVGRADELGVLLRTVTADGGVAVPVVAVTGSGGVGKSTLTLHAAHLLQEAFPDGQLYVDLRGGQEQPAGAGQVLTRFLTAMGVPGSDIADEVEARADAYRSLLAGRRVLVVLDDAADEAQVRPLLPGTTGPAVLVTSRSRLVGLPLASSIELDGFEPDQALDLMTRLIGAERVTAELSAAHDLVRLCGGLPLALRIAGVRLAARPHWSLHDLVARLGDDRRYLDELTYGPLSVRSSLAADYRALDPRERRLFRLLGLTETDDFGVATAAALLDVSFDDAAEACERLAEMRLLGTTGPDGADHIRFRLRFPRLTRAYARERAEESESYDARPATPEHPPDVRTVANAEGLHAGRPPLRQLPAVPGRFLGREDELRQLDEFRAGPHRTVLLIGAAGVGKTTLAAHWARRAATLFPNGQIFLDMRGFDSGSPISPEEALPRLLQALGQRPEDIPVDVGAQIALYRSVLAGRSVLIVLDNVADPAQVRPLLPGEPRCLVVVTSRDKLGGLVALDGARRIVVDVLGHDESLLLIAQGIGEARLSAEPEAAAVLVRLCGYLPLALCVAGARLADQPHQTVGQYVTDLTEHGRLARLRVDGDERATVRAAFDLTYRSLPVPAQRLFRLLSLLPSRAMTASGVAALAGITGSEAQDLLGILTRVHLVTATGTNRYVCHDLLLEYAAERSSDQDSLRERNAAVRRMLDFYLHTITNVKPQPYAELAVLPREHLASGVSPESFTDSAQAMTWFDAEWRNLTALITHVCEYGPRRMAWQLVNALRDVLYRRRSRGEWLYLTELGLAAAREEHDILGQGAMHLSRGFARWCMGDFHASIEEYEQAMRLCREVGWREGETVALRGSGVALKQQGATERAIDRYKLARKIDQQIGYRHGEAADLNNLASATLAAGRLKEAEHYLGLALPMTRETGQRELEVITLVNLGLVRQEQGHITGALAILGESLALAHQIGSRYGQAWSLHTIGLSQSDAGRYEQAIVAHKEALAIAQQTEDRGHKVLALTGLARAEIKLGHVESAATRLAAALSIAEQTGYREGQIEVLLVLSSHALGDQSYQAAHDYAQKALDLARTSHELAVGRAHAALAAACLAMGEEVHCSEHCAQALRLLHSTGQQLAHARTLIVFGYSRQRAGHGLAARSIWRRAHTVLSGIGAAEREETAKLSV